MNYEFERNDRLVPKFKKIQHKGLFHPTWIPRTIPRQPAEYLVPEVAPDFLIIAKWNRWTLRIHGNQKRERREPDVAAGNLCGTTDIPSKTELTLWLSDRGLRSRKIRLSWILAPDWEWRWNGSDLPCSRNPMRIWTPTCAEVSQGPTNKATDKPIP